MPFKGQNGWLAFQALVLASIMISYPLVEGFTTRQSLIATRPAVAPNDLNEVSRVLTSLMARRSGDFDNEDEEDDDENRSGIFARVRRRRGRRGYYDDDSDDDREMDDDVGRAADQLEARGIFDRYDIEDEEEEEEGGGIFENVLIPNPILDNIDPDGAAERFPELARDPKFWLDIFLFLAFINFVSFIGPRNPFPDMPALMYKATLPPPGI
ncbi:hypothetical protein IV203_018071 [Nitzschia inconspicua]|uniref:Uncharacterized protein n=1 Tax=Nitzschia inconspicua TaxID=303405 RepID=A0A9K3M0V5_9STRA|nr:hypothetical protein IV203_018071 [Nitzschia inconspicua]